jgi:hypothetical protein
MQDHRVQVAVKAPGPVAPSKPMMEVFVVGDRSAVDAILAL